MRPTQKPQLTREIIREALAASGTGVWVWDVENDVARCCSNTAKLFGFTPEQGIRGVAERAFSDRIVDEDRQDHADQLRRAVEKGGLFVTECRVEPSPGRTNRLLVRGRFEPGPDGRVRHARGIVIELTGIHDPKEVASPASVLEDPEPTSTVCERLADQAIALWHMQAESAIADELDIERELRSILLKIARCLTREDGAAAHVPHRVH